MTTRILRLLLLAALAWPTWMPATAQDGLEAKLKNSVAIFDASKEKKSSTKHIKKNVYKEVLPEKRHDTSQNEVHSTCIDETGHQKHLSGKTTSLKAIGNQIYDYTEVSRCTGSYTSQVLPITVPAFTGERSEGQMLYSSTTLNLPTGVEIVSITFYANAKIPDLGTNKVTLRVKETQATSISNYNDVTSNRANMDVVYEGPMPTGSQWPEFNFKEPITYNGGNLLVDLTLNSGDTNATVNWYGKNSAGYSYYSYKLEGASSPTTNSSYFLPTIYILYRTPHSGTIEARDIAIKNKSFFEGKTYRWPYNVDYQYQTESNLSEPATDPDQMIAMLRKVYMDQEIPGNKKRGFGADGSDNTTNQQVYYSGVGGIKYNASSATIPSLDVNSYSYDDIYGWGIDGNPINPTISLLSRDYSSWYSQYKYTYSAYTYLDPNQYEPEDEGLTLILVELKDTYVDGSNNTIKNSSAYNTEYERLRAYFQNTVKSVKIVSEAVRTGEGFGAGTLFKIDCDQMNKFFLLAKGQLHLDHNSTVQYESYDTNVSDFCPSPAYFTPLSFYADNDDFDNLRYLSVGTGNFLDDNTGELFYHMFEQFSPVIPSASQGRDDIYQDLVNMESFGVKHDCLGITRMNHQFLMYGAESEDKDCQDVRDMMFFVPDYRMLDNYNRDPDVAEQQYLNYHLDLQPTIGLYVIRQEPVTVTETTVEPTGYTDDYYHLTLTWNSNLDDFLPSQDQEYELLELVYDEETGKQKYQPVYYTKIATDGKTVVYYDPETGQEGVKVPVTMTLGPDEDKIYTDVYVQRQSSSQQVTYAIRGRDAKGADGKHFLSLQISNQESFIIPGTDPAELVSLVELSHYSRYNPKTQHNCYSNRFKMENTPAGIVSNNLTGAQGKATVFTFTRKTSANDPNPVVIATATVQSAATKKMTVQMMNQSPISDFPETEEKNEDGTPRYAGYHANQGDTWEYTYTVKDGAVIFDNFILTDNFTVDVSQNAHPSQYIYEVSFNPQNVGFEGNAHGSAFRVYIYKTATQINGIYTAEQVLADTQGTLGCNEQGKLETDVNFGVDVDLSSKTEIYRYDAYRWGETEDRYILKSADGDDEQDIAPTGLADNQGDTYTTSMNPGTAYHQTGVADVDGDTGTATFVDKLPAASTDPVAYLYAPVIETFSVGKDTDGNKRTDYNTYGGQMQSAAVGKLNVEVAPNDKDHPRMSKYSWPEGDGVDKYAYYNIPLIIKTKLAPQGYSLYGIRAWRMVDDAENVLGEEYEAMNARMGAKVMFEEVLYDPSNVALVDAKDNLGDVEKSATVTGANGSEHEISYTSGTFGARKVGKGTGEIPELTGTFKIRLYFTRNANLPTIQGAPRLKDVATDADGKFYIVEQEVPFTISANDIITAIDQLNAREVAGVKYYNVAGVESDRPFKGVNIVVTRYSDGSMSTTKIVK